MSSVRSVSASAPGKTNLFFAVGPLLADGFHDVASVYLALDLREEVTVSTAEAWSVNVSGNISAEQIAAVPTGEDNLVVRAAKHVAELAGVSAQATAFAIDKHVPVAGGMGGGSADAAAALVAVNALWQTGVDAQLANCVELGADIPFALAGGIAVGLGRGEVLTQIDSVPAIHLVLVTSDPLAVPAALRLAKRSVTKMRQNLFWAAGYNLVAIPLAAGALMPLGLVLSPAIGAVLMSLSTIIVAANAQLLRR